MLTKLCGKIFKRKLTLKRNNILYDGQNKIFFYFQNEAKKNHNFILSIVKTNFFLFLYVYKKNEKRKKKNIDSSNHIIELNQTSFLAKWIRIFDEPR